MTSPIAMKPVFSSVRLSPVLGSLTLLMMGIVACVTDADVSSGLAVQMDTVGDTISVHTRSGSQWGDTAVLVAGLSIGELEGEPAYTFGRIGSLAVGPRGNLHVLDTQAGEVRVFSPDGGHIRTMGRLGDGPGEVGRPSALGILSDGRVLVRDPANLRVQVFDSLGKASEEWGIIDPTYYTSLPVWVDESDRSYIVTKGEPDAEGRWPTIVLQVSPAGEVLDTIPDPGAHIEPRVAAIRDSQGRVRMTVAIPHYPSSTWAFHPSGSVVRGSADGNAVEVLNQMGQVRRISRAWEAVEIPDGERRQSEMYVNFSMRNNDPDWKWDAPPVPQVKPAVEAVRVGIDGRIWVLASQEAVEIENADHDPENEYSTPTFWRSATAFDLFEPDGTWLARVTTPEGFSASTAVFTSDGVWAVTRDDLGVERVTWFELVPRGGGGVAAVAIRARSLHDDPVLVLSLRIGDTT